MNYLENNLRCLICKKPELVSRIGESDEKVEVSVVPSDCGMPTMGVRLDSGQTSFLHSIIDPIRESARLLGNVEFKRWDGTVLFGLGLGYTAKEILVRKDKGHIVYIIEGLVEAFKEAMVHVDLADIIEDDDVHLFVGASRKEVLNGLRPLDRKVVSGRINKISTESLYRPCRGFYDEVSELIERHVASVKTGAVAFDVFRNKCLENAFRNIPEMIRSRPVDMLKGVAKGKAALVVGAGPTLSNDLQSIKENRDKFVVISVDAALKPLLQRGVVPDLVVTCDPTALSEKKLEGISCNNLGSIPLIYQVDCTPSVVKRFKGTKYVTGSDNSLTQWLANIGQKVQKFEGIQSVSHLAFCVADFMGADPIILAGVDLSFPGGKDHAVGCAKTWGGRDLKSRDRQCCPKVRNNKGEVVDTCPGFISMIHMLEKIIDKTCEKTVYNVSLEGAVIRGAKYIPFDEVAKEVDGCKEKTLETMCVGVCEETIDKLATTYSGAVSWLLEECHVLASICKKANASIGRVSNGKETGRAGRAGELGRLFEDTFKHRAILDILTDYLPRFMKRSDRLASEERLVLKGQVAARQMECMTVFFEELEEALSLVKGQCMTEGHAIGQW